MTTPPGAALLLCMEVLKIEGCEEGVVLWGRYKVGQSSKIVKILPASLVHSGFTQVCHFSAYWQI